MPEISISYITIGGSTTWGQLDNAVRRAFKQHVARLDPGGGLGLGEILRLYHFEYGIESEINVAKS